MPKTIDKSKLTHLLVVRGGGQHLFEERGAGGLDLILIAGVPEPLENFAEGFADALVAGGVCVPVTADGRTEDGKRHPSVPTGNEVPGGPSAGGITPEPAPETSQVPSPDIPAVSAETAVPATEG